MQMKIIISNFQNLRVTLQLKNPDFFTHEEHIEFIP